MNYAQHKLEENCNHGTTKNTMDILHITKENTTERFHIYNSSKQSSQLINNHNHLKPNFHDSFHNTKKCTTE